MKTEPVLITSLTRRLTAIRNEAFSLIQNAVAKHRILGTFYQNLGKHYAHDQTLEQYDTAPIVITHNDSFGTYGGYAAATVYELFIDEKGRLLCTLNGEAGEDFNEPLEHIQIEGLLCIVRWLMKHGLVIDNPWRCEVCGSLAVQEQIWVDTNTCEAYSQAYNRDEITVATATKIPTQSEKANYCKTSTSGGTVWTSGRWSALPATVRTTLTLKMVIKIS